MENVALQCFPFELDSNTPRKLVRFCPWNDTQTHVGPGARLRFWIHARVYGIGSLRPSIFECYQTYDQNTPPARLPFNPAGPMRNLDRQHPEADTWNLLDDSTPIEPELFGYEIWFEGPAAVKEARSPAITMDQDTVPPPDQGDIEYTIVIETGDPQVALKGSLEVYVEVIPAEAVAAMPTFNGKQRAKCAPCKGVSKDVATKAIAARLERIGV